MALVTTASVVRQIESLFDGGSVAGLSDSQLIERFNDRRDPTGEAAFAALVARHGPMVLHVCRQLVSDEHYAEDAFQAVFLVLARKSGSIRDPERLGNWLYGVAIRTARKARRGLARRQRKEDGHTMRHARSVAGVAVEPAEHRISASALALAREVIRLMHWHKLKAATLSLLIIATLAVGVGYCSLNALAHSRDDEPRGTSRRTPARTEPRPLEHILAHSRDDEPRGTSRRTPARTEPRPPADMPGASTVANNDPHPAPGRMFVTGRVLDPRGKPVANATTMVYADPKQPLRSNRPERMAPPVIGEAISDASGRFQLVAARTSSSTHEKSMMIAIAPGFGAGWVDLNLDADRHTADITLRPEQVIQGRVFDLQGAPAQGVAVSVGAMGRLLRDPEGDPDDFGLDGPEFLRWKQGTGLPAWPRPALTDAQGRFTVRGAGQGLRAVLAIDDARFVKQQINVDTDKTPNSKPVISAVQPARSIVGRVVAADTGKPIAHAIVTGNMGDVVETDRDGRFRARADSSDRHVVQVLAPEEQPYLNVRTAEFAWTKGALEHRMDLTLPRGIVIRGRVTEEGSGEPIAGTMLGYLAGSPADPREPWFGNAWSGPDGSFQLAVSPKATHLIALGPSEDYVLQVKSERLIEEGRPGGHRIYAHAFIAYDQKSGGDTRTVDVVLHRGITVKGEVIGPDGKPVQEAQMFSRILLMPSGVPWRSWQGFYHGSVRNGRFELHGLASKAEIPVFFLEPKRKLGAMVNISGKSGLGGPITVRLESCGTARARLVDPAGKPLAGYRDPYLIGMVVTSGPPWYSRDKADQSRLAGERDFVCRLDPINYPNGCVSDGSGRVIFSALVPGATYQIDDMTAIGANGGGTRRNEFTVKPGETLELGDIRIEKPEE